MWQYTDVAVQLRTMPAVQLPACSMLWDFLQAELAQSQGNYFPETEHMLKDRQHSFSQQNLLCTGSTFPASRI
jgi:hypothetical protein